MKNKTKRIAAFLCSVLVLCLLEFPAMASELGIFDKIRASSVERLSKWEFFHYEKGGYYVLRFQLKDGNDKLVESPADVLVSITDEAGEIIFIQNCSLASDDYITWTNKLLGDQRFATIIIEPEEIKETETGVGTVHFCVTQPGYFFFKTLNIETEDLPKIDITALCSLELPDLPVETSHTVVNTLVSKAIVQEVEYEFVESYSGLRLNLYVTGEKTFDMNGKNSNDKCYIPWKLFAKDNCVVKSGTVITSVLKMGEKFKRQDETVHGLEPGAYRLEFVTE